MAGRSDDDTERGKLFAGYRIVRQLGTGGITDRRIPPTRHRVRSSTAQNPTTVKCGGGKIGHDDETTRAGHPVRRCVSVQLSAPRADSKFEKLPS
jgi:hypothetical protein